jgi:pyruvate/2-oxoglutarate dehydrogenase complex dihydrolipoamide acyltransferase (E2) component
VATVLSVVSTLLVGGVAWGLVSAQADDAPLPAPSAPSLPASTATATATATAPLPASAAQPRTAAPAATSVAAATATTTAVPVPPRPATPAGAKATIPTGVTIQAINTTAGEAQQYRAVFRGVLTATPKKKQALTQQPVVLMVRVKGASAWTRAVTAVSSAPDGKLLVAVEQDAPVASYKFVFDADAPYKSSSSAVVTVKRV